MKKIKNSDFHGSNPCLKCQLQTLPFFSRVSYCSESSWKMIFFCIFSNWPIFAIMQELQESSWWCIFSCNEKIELSTRVFHRNIFEFAFAPWFFNLLKNLRKISLFRGFVTFAQFHKFESKVNPNLSRKIWSLLFSCNVAKSHVE